MSKRDDAVAALKERLNHTFEDPDLLERALTHASGAGKRSGGNNERLEFLGDRVLGLVCSEMLYRRFDTVPEGELARMLNALVRRDMCTRVAKRLDLGPALKLAGKGVKRTQITNNILGDACEALIAAIYLDGGLKAAEDFFAEHWKDALGDVQNMRKDAKTALQEWAAGKALPAPTYEITGQEGPDHAPQFSVKMELPGYDEAHGTAGTRRMAEQLAAEAFLKREKLWT